MVERLNLIRKQNHKAGLLARALLAERDPDAYASIIAEAAAHNGPFTDEQVERWLRTINGIGGGAR
jgi:hypothetical protein